MLILARTILFAAVAFAHWRLFLPSDDAYIHLRIARNLVQTGAPYFNPGEPHMSSSSTVWTLVLAGFLSIFGEMRIELLRFSNLFICLWGALVWGRFLRRLTGNAAAALLGEVIFIGSNASSSISLMETPLALAIAGVAALRLIDRRWGGFALLSVAVFVRLDVGIGLVAAAIAELMRKRHGPPRFRRIASEIALGSLPFLLYGIWFFGGVIPQTIRAKAIVYDVGSAELVQLIFRVLLGENAIKNGDSAIWYSVAVFASLLWLAFSRISRDSLARTESLVCLLLIASGGFLLLSYMEERVMLFHWYVPLFVVPITMGTVGLACALSVLSLRVLAGLLLVPPVLGLANLVAGSIDESLHPDFATAARVRSYLSIGEDLNERFPDARLMTSEIGGLGWTFRGKVLDAAGLASPESLAYHPMKVPDERPSGMLAMIPPGLVREKLPELIVSMDVFISPERIPELQTVYAVEERPVFLPEDAERLGKSSLWQSSHINVWIRRDLLSSK